MTIPWAAATTAAPWTAGPYTAANATAATGTWVGTASAVSSSGPLQVSANAASNNVAGAVGALGGVFAAVAYLL